MGSRGEKAAARPAQAPTGTDQGTRNSPMTGGRDVNMRKQTKISKTNAVSQRQWILLIFLALTASR